MARTKEYDRDKVLDAATLVFWEKGYIGTSVNALVQATGLGKRSMYQEFGSKEKLFEECIRNYILRINREAVIILNRTPLGLANIEDFLANRIDYASSVDCHGCMIINSAIEKELIDASAFEMVKAALSSLEDAIYSCLEAARSDGEIPGDKDCRTLASFLSTLTAGIMVKSKTEPDRKVLAASVDSALSIVKN